MKIAIVICLFCLMRAGGPPAFAAGQPTPSLSAPYLEAFSKPGVLASRKVSQALAALDASQPKSIAGVIEAAAEIWPQQLPGLLSQASEANPRWAPLMTAAAVGARPVDAVALRAAAISGLDRARAQANLPPAAPAPPLPGQGGVGKELLGKEPVGKEPVGKEPVDKEPVDKEPVGGMAGSRGPGWLDLTPSQYDQLVQAINVATATALRNGLVGNWLFDGLINTTVDKRRPIILNPFDPPLRLPIDPGAVVTPIQP